MPTLKRAITATLVLLSLFAIAGCQAAPVEKLVWSDEFGGPAGAPPNPKYWGYQLGANGWGNQELECYTRAPTNVAQDGRGYLVITARKQAGRACSDGHVTDYTSARILTKSKFSTEFGRIEIRAKLPNSSGTWPAFWALGDNIDQVGWPKAGEIDVVEAVGSAPGMVYGTLHGPSTSGAPLQISRSTDSRTDLSANFHVYAAEWAPDSITFSIDGSVYGAVSKSEVQRAQGTWVWNQRFYLLLNLAVGGDFPGPPSQTSSWPQTFTIDYVRVYK